MSEEGFDLSRPHQYRPTAIYYEEGDSLEYVREDVPAVYRRIDNLLTLVLDMGSRQPIGFKLKGFRHFYLKHLASKQHENGASFLNLVSVMEKACCLLGDKIFEHDAKRQAYQRAIDIAEADQVQLRDIPQVA